MKKNILEILTSTDISFASVVLFGQAVIKFMSGIAKSDVKKNWQKVAFISSLLFILGIVPAVSFLIIMYTNKEISKIVYMFQSIWFLLAIISYWIIGTIGQMYLDE